MSFPSFDKIIESESINFGITKKNFGDIIEWAEVLKNILQIQKVHDGPGPIEYYQLFHLLGNSFVNAVLLLSKGYIFHSYAISRIGFESFFQIAIIESNYNENLNVWQNFSYERPDSKRWKIAWRKYDKIFVKDRSKHDYSAFINDEIKDVLVNRWKFLSSYGSHVSFIQTLFSFDIREIGESDIVYSGLFDTNENNTVEIGKSIIWIIDSFFILAVSTSKIFENHNVYLAKNNSQINELWEEWLSSKISILKELGITPPKVNTDQSTP